MWGMYFFIFASCEPLRIRNWKVVDMYISVRHHFITCLWSDNYKYYLFHWRRALVKQRFLLARVACSSETCAILKHVSDWRGVPFWKMCISDTRFGMAPCKLCHIEDRKQYVFVTYCVWCSPTLITEKQTIKCSLDVLLVSLHQFLCFRTLHLTCDFNMTKFVQCQSETCFRMAHDSERFAAHAISLLTHSNHAGSVVNLWWLQVRNTNGQGNKTH